MTSYFISFGLSLELILDQNFQNKTQSMFGKNILIGFQYSPLPFHCQRNYTRLRFSIPFVEEDGAVLGIYFKSYYALLGEGVLG